jgi:hypothetical protein
VLGLEESGCTGRFSWASFLHLFLFYFIFKTYIKEVLETETKERRGKRLVAVWRQLQNKKKQKLRLVLDK